MATGLISWIAVLIWQAKDYRVFVAAAILAMAMAGARWVDRGRGKPLFRMGLVALAGSMAFALLLWNHQIAIGRTTLPTPAQAFLGHIQGTLQYRPLCTSIRL